MARKLCSVEGCERPVKAHALCQTHYMRLRRHGDINMGRTPPGTREDFYQTVVLGWDADDCLLWPFSLNSAGYAVMRLDGRQVYVHRRLCEEAHGAPPTPTHETAHSCGNGHNGCVAKAHLRWASSAENHLDMVYHGRSTRGRKNSQCKLSEGAVRRIRHLQSTLTQEEIARLEGISQSTVSLILSRKLWAWLA